MTAVPDSDLVSDAQLAVAAAAGDRAAFAEIYDRYADRLYDFCVGMVRDRNTAADCVQDTFCTAATRLASLRDPDKLRPWLYAIARNEALRCIRERRREQPSDELPETTSSDPSPDTLAVRSELAELVAQAAGGLSDRDRTVLELTYRHGMDGPELAEALGVSAATARTLTHRLRETVERSLGALLVVRNARTGQGCAELAASVKDWDGEFTVLTRKRVARHIDSCPVCEGIRRKMVNPRALLGGAPLFIAAPPGLRKRTLDRIQLTCAETALTEPGSADAAAGGADNAAAQEAAAPGAALVGSATAPTATDALDATDVSAGDAAGHGARDDDERRRRRGLLVLFLLLAMALFAALWLTIAWPFANDTPLAPAGVPATSSQPRPTPRRSLDHAGAAEHSAATGGQYRRSSYRAAAVQAAHSPEVCSTGAGPEPFCPYRLCCATDSEDHTDFHSIHGGGPVRSAFDAVGNHALEVGDLRLGDIGLRDIGLRYSRSLRRDIRPVGRLHGGRDVNLGGADELPHGLSDVCLIRFAFGTPVGVGGQGRPARTG